MLADTVYLYRVPKNLVGLRCGVLQLYRLNLKLWDIGNFTALQTTNMMMWLPVGLQTGRPMMEAYLRQHSMIDERTDVLVHGRKRDGWNLLPDKIVNSFRTGVTVHGPESVPDHLTLVRQGQASGATELPKLLH